MMATYMVTLAILTAGVAPASSGGFQVERIFGPEIPTGKYKHPACFTELDNGDLYLAFYGGEGEYEGDTKDFGSRLKKGETKWSAPEVIADTPWLSEGNPVVWQAPDGLVWLYYLNRFGETWSESRIRAKISRDGARTWSDPMQITWDLGTMVRSHPIVLSSGDYLLPVYKETGHDKEKVGSGSTSYFLRYNPKDHTWKETGHIRSKNGNIQPAVVQITEDYLVAYCRRGGGYEPDEVGYVVRAESHDAGLTWSEGANSQFPNPNAAVDFKKLRNGHLVLAYNDSMNERNPLTVAISTDSDQSYPHKRVIIEKAGGDFGYPTILQTKDGRIHLMFTSEERTVINHVAFDEEDILNPSGR
jgi:predicted neuraminidase